MTLTGSGTFEVKDCAMITMALGRSAHDLHELRRGVVEAPLGSLYHHFFHTLLRPSFDDPEYRNDFALWARRQLHDFQLAERLDVVDPIDFPDLEDLRRRLLHVIDTRLAEIDQVPRAAPGRPFHFLRSQLVVFGTGLSAGTPGQLAEIVPRLSGGSIFYHFVEARRRPPRRVDDFSHWLEGWGPVTEPVRERIAAIDFYLWTLTEMRVLIARCFEPLATEAVRT